MLMNEIISNNYSNNSKCNKREMTASSAQSSSSSLSMPSLLWCSALKVAAQTAVKQHSTAHHYLYLYSYFNFILSFFPLYLPLPFIVWLLFYKIIFGGLFTCVSVSASTTTKTKFWWAKM